MTITLTEFQKVVRTPTARQIGRMGDRHFAHEEMWTDGCAAFWGKPVPEGVEMKSVLQPEMLMASLRDYALRATVPVSIRGVRADSWKGKPTVTEAILETKDGRFILVNAKYLAFALKGIDERRETIRAHESDTYAPIGVFDARGGLVAIIMPRHTNYPSPGWQTIIGQGLPGWEPPPPPSAEEINGELDVAETDDDWPALSGKELADGIRAALDE